MTLRVRADGREACGQSRGMVCALQPIMGAGRSHENLIAWQLCEELADRVSAMIAKGPITRDFNFCDQLRRAAGAPGPNIAEGFARFGPKEFAHFLRMALGSLMETRTFLLRGQRQAFWSDEAARAALSLCDRAIDMTRKLLASKVRQVEATQTGKNPPPKSPNLRVGPRL